MSYENGDYCWMQIHFMKCKSSPVNGNIILSTFYSVFIVIVVVNCRHDILYISSITFIKTSTVDNVIIYCPFADAVGEKVLCGKHQCLPSVDNKNDRYKKYIFYKFSQIFIYRVLGRY